MVGTKKASLYRKKRKGFSGRRRQAVDNAEEIESPLPIPSGEGQSTSTPEKANRSFEKITRNCPLLKQEKRQMLTRKRAHALGFEPIKRKERKLVGSTTPTDLFAAHGFKLMNMNNLQSALFSTAICKFCKSSKGRLMLFQNDQHRRGLDEELVIKCQNCHENTSFCTSPKVRGEVGRSSEVNARCVQAGIETGFGLRNMQKLCTLFGLPLPLSNTAYYRMTKMLEICYSAEADLSLQKAASNLKDHMQAQYAECKDLDPISDVFEVAVSVDGTWQKRYGYNSLAGVVFIIAIETGEVLDFEVRSKVCFQCRAREHIKGTQEYDKWWDSHKGACEINHSGSAESMEKDAAVEMFLRSIAKHRLKYTVYIGDGDSSSYGVVADAVFQKYGPEYLVLKEDCIGHIQKRMGNSLRTYKKKVKGSRLADGGSVGGRGRLTDAVIDSLQNYYGYAIKGNTNNLKSMQDAIWAIYFHTISGKNEALTVQHKYCPKGTESWCKYQKDFALKTKTYDRSNCLPPVFRKELLPIFKRLSNTDLLSRCLRGLTQNQNESLNNILWLNVQKEFFVVKDD